MLIEKIRPSRRAFLAGSAGLVVGFYLAPLGRRAPPIPIKAGVPADAAGHAIRAERLRAHRARRHGDRPLQAHRDGPGRLHRSPDHRGRRARRRLEPDARGCLPGGRRDLQEPGVRPVMGTGGSTAIANSYDSAAARPAPRRAPCWSPPPPQEWGVPEAEITVESGRIRHAASSRESGFGALAEKAAAVKLSGEPKLKDPKDFRLIGTDIHRLDTAAKSNGQGDLHHRHHPARHADRAGRCTPTCSAPR